MSSCDLDSQRLQTDVMLRFASPLARAASMVREEVGAQLRSLGDDLAIATGQPPSAPVQSNRVPNKSPSCVIQVEGLNGDTVWLDGAERHE